MDKIGIVDKILMLYQQRDNFRLRHEYENEDSNFRESYVGITNDEDFYSWRKSQKIKTERFYEDSLIYAHNELDNLVIEETLIENISLKHLKELKDNLLNTYKKINKL